MLMLRPNVSPVLPDFPDCATLDGVHVNFYYVVFLSADEYRTKLDNGLDALIDRFEADEKDLIAFRSPALSASEE